MRLTFLFTTGLFIIFTSCGKYSKRNIETDLGIIDEKKNEINYLPYLTNLQRLKDAIKVDGKFELEVYNSDKVTEANSIETGSYLALKKGNGTITKWYLLSKKPIYGKINVNSGDPLRVDVNTPFIDIHTSKPSPQTVYFDAEKDSIYTICLGSDDSVGGIVFCSILDSLGNKYYSDVISHMGAGGGASLSSSNKYTLTALFSGRIYIECYGIKPAPDEHHTLDNYTLIWIQQ